MKKEKTPTQTDHIREHLVSGHSINGLDALNLFGCFRLAARIHQLKEDEGLDIKSRQIKTSGGATISEYWMPSASTTGQGELF